MCPKHQSGYDSVGLQAARVKPMPEIRHKEEALLRACDNLVWNQGVALDCESV